jgi:hypothetical protein
MPIFAFVREIWNIKPCVHDPPDFCDISDKKKKKGIYETELSYHQFNCYIKFSRNTKLLKE